MVDETTKPLSTPEGNLSSSPDASIKGQFQTIRPGRILDSTGRAASEGMSQAITTIALYPLLQVFRLLSKLASRSLIAGDTENRSNQIVQDTARPHNEARVSTDGSNGATKRPSSGVQAADLAKEPNSTPATVQISLDTSFDGLDPVRPTPLGSRTKRRGRVT